MGILIVKWRDSRRVCGSCFRLHVASMNCLDNQEIVQRNQETKLHDRDGLIGRLRGGSGVEWEFSPWLRLLELSHGSDTPHQPCQSLRLHKQK